MENKVEIFQIFNLSEISDLSAKNKKIEEICKKSRRFVCAYLEYHRTNI